MITLICTYINTSMLQAKLSRPAHALMQTFFSDQTLNYQVLHSWLLNDSYFITERALFHSLQWPPIWKFQITYIAKSFFLSGQSIKMVLGGHHKQCKKYAYFFLMPRIIKTCQGLMTNEIWPKSYMLIYDVLKTCTFLLF